METTVRSTASSELPVPEVPASAHALLQGRSPREILGRIVPNDPLRMRARVGRRLEAEALLLDADRVHLRALALCARAALRYRGKPELEAWLEARAAEALREVLEEGEEVARDGKPAALRATGAFASLAPPLGLDADEMRRACARFNRLPADERRAFFDLVLRSHSLDELARTQTESATEIARRARRALDVLLGVELAGGSST